MQRRQFLTSAAAATFLSASDMMRGQSPNAESGQPLPTESSSPAAARRIPRVTSPGTTRGEQTIQTSHLCGRSHVSAQSHYKQIDRPTLS
jgi:hypothetical protein